MPISRGNGCPIYYEVHGSGYPVLMITGMASVVEWFHYNIPAFVDAGYQVIAQDLRGSNRPGIQPEGGEYSTYDMAMDSLRLMDELGIEKAHLVGLSMGGMMVQHLAIRHGERVSRASIVGNGLARCPKEIAEAALTRNPATDVGRMHARENLTREEFRRNNIGVVFTPGFETEKPEKFRFWWDNIPLPHPETQAAQTVAAVRHDTLDELGSVSCPFQVLVGKLDAVNAASAPLMAERIRGCDFRVLEGMNHGLNLEHSEEYNRIVLDFLGAPPGR